jgi:N-acetylglutamate synthase-like GNAT family acetyltransferase
MLPSPNVPLDRLNDHVPTSGGMQLSLRSFHARDRDEVLRLYHHGLLTGVPNPLDPATDLDHIEQIYLTRPQDHFWVAETNGEVIGSVAITEDDAQIAHVRRLRVDPAWKMWRSGEVARVLIQKATHHARQHDCLKLVLHTPVNDDRAIAFLHELGFEYARARELSGRHLLEFYINLYTRTEQPVTHFEGLA